MELGWVGMVSGFSVVLYSRLNLLVQNRRILHLVLAMIIVDGICLHSSTITIQFGLSSQPKNDLPKRAPWLVASIVIERVQSIGFTVQQLIITAVYMKTAWNYLRDRLLPDGRAKTIMTMLIAVQVLVACIDITVIGLESAGYFIPKLIIHSFVYAIKLELEFVILNQLISISQLGATGLMSIPAEMDSRAPDSSGTIVRSPTFGLDNYDARGSPTAEIHGLDGIATPENRDNGSLSKTEEKSTNSAV
jgi:hypothetical protein